MIAHVQQYLYAHPSRFFFFLLQLAPTGAAFHIPSARASKASPARLGAGSLADTRARYVHLSANLHAVVELSYHLSAWANPAHSSSLKTSYKSSSPCIYCVSQSRHAVSTVTHFLNGDFGPTNDVSAYKNHLVFLSAALILTQPACFEHDAICICAAHSFSMIIVLCLLLIIAKGAVRERVPVQRQQFLHQPAPGRQQVHLLARQVLGHPVHPMHTDPLYVRFSPAFACVCQALRRTNMRTRARIVGIINIMCVGVCLVVVVVCVRVCLCVCVCCLLYTSPSPRD